MNYPKKTGFNLYQLAALCLYNIHRENLVLKNLSVAIDSTPPPGYENCSMGSLFYRKRKICFKSSIVNPLTLLTVISSNSFFFNWRVLADLVDGWAGGVQDPAAGLPPLAAHQGVPSLRTLAARRTTGMCIFFIRWFLFYSMIYLIQWNWTSCSELKHIINKKLLFFYCFLHLSPTHPSLYVHFVPCSNIHSTRAFLSVTRPPPWWPRWGLTCSCAAGIKLSLPPGTKPSRPPGSRPSPPTWSPNPRTHHRIPRPTTNYNTNNNNTTW